MANVTIPISVSATDVVKGAVQRIVADVEFKESVSEEYKKGFYDFGNLIVELLNKMEGEKK